MIGMGLGFEAWLLVPPSGSCRSLLGGLSQPKNRTRPQIELKIAERETIITKIPRARSNTAQRQRFAKEVPQISTAQLSAGSLPASHQGGFCWPIHIIS